VPGRRQGGVAPGDGSLVDSQQQDPRRASRKGQQRSARSAAFCGEEQVVIRTVPLILPRNLDQCGPGPVLPDQHPVDEYEGNRNAAIHEAQGNRNPLIDHPGLAERIDFGAGFGQF